MTTRAYSEAWDGCFASFEPVPVQRASIPLTDSEEITHQRPRLRDERSKIGDARMTTTTIRPLDQQIALMRLLTDQLQQCAEALRDGQDRVMLADGQWHDAFDTLRRTAQSMTRTSQQILSTVTH
jgi:hypothetical protein